MLFVDYKKYIVSAEWKRFRLRKLASVNYKCERKCGRTAREVHHKHYNTLGHESFEDVEALCRQCHAAETRKNRVVRNRKISTWPF